MKQIFLLVGILSVMSLVIIFSDFGEDYEVVNSAGVIIGDGYTISVEERILEGEKAKEYVIKSLGNNSYYLKIFEEDYNRYINKEHHFKNNFARLIIKPERKCGDKWGCTAGYFDTNGVTFINISLYDEIIGINSDEWIFDFLHENGHLLQNYYFNVTDAIQWNDMIHEKSMRLLREGKTNEFWRDYPKKSSDEDFADSYAIYRLGDEYAINMFGKTITEDRKEFVERIENKAKSYLDDNVIVLKVSG